MRVTERVISLWTVYYMMQDMHRHSVYNAEVTDLNNKHTRRIG